MHVQKMLFAKIQKEKVVLPFFKMTLKNVDISLVIPKKLTHGND